LHAYVTRDCVCVCVDPVLQKDIVPRPGIYDANFIAANQEARADNCIEAGVMHVQLMTAGRVGL
jgi:hypothetical protein